jgi:dTDP-4-amino-4,6-dideoxygalactose transaminase
VIRSPQRDGLALDLAKLGIQTLIHYPIPPHLQQAYKDAGYVKGDFPIAEMLADEVLSLPIGPHLPVEQAKRVADAIRGWSARGASEDLAECVRSSG